MCGGFWGMNYGGGSWLWMTGFSIFRLILIAGVLIWIIKLITKTFNKSYFTSNRAMDLLHERYANGEITEEEYIHKKRILNR